MTVLFLLAQTEGIPVNWTSLVQGGVLGIIVILFIFGQIVSGRMYDRAVAENERLNGELTTVRDSMEEKVIPALTRSSDALTKATDLLAQAAQRERNLREALDRERYDRGTGGRPPRHDEEN